MLRGRLPAAAVFAVWLVLALALLVPVGIPARWSPFGLVPRFGTAETPPAAVTVPLSLVQGSEFGVAPLGALTLPEVTGPAVAPVAVPVQQPGLMDRLKEIPASRWATLVWLAGVAVLVLRRAAALMIFSRKLRRSLAPADERTASAVERCRELLGIRGEVKSGVTSLVETPALHGIFAPRLLMPVGMAGRLSDAELELVVLHELGHLRRRDLLAQTLIHAAAVLHWFNPLAWLAAHAARADCEHACDEFVLGRVEEGRREDYGAVLLKVVGLGSGPGRLPAVLGIFESKKQLQRRIHLIAGYSSPHWIKTIAGAALLAVIALVSLTRESAAQAPVAASAPPLPAAKMPETATATTAATPTLNEVMLSNDLTQGSRVETKRARLETAVQNGAQPAPAVGQWSYSPRIDPEAVRLLESNLTMAQQKVADLERREKAGEDVAESLVVARLTESELRRRMADVAVVENKSNPPPQISVSAVAPTVAAAPAQQDQTVQRVISEFGPNGVYFRRPNPDGTAAAPAAGSSIRLIAIGTVRVQVNLRNADGTDGAVVLANTELRAGDSRVVPWNTALNLTATEGANLQLEVNGNRLGVGFTGYNRAWLRAPEDAAVQIGGLTVAPVPAKGIDPEGTVVARVGDAVITMADVMKEVTPMLPGIRASAVDQTDYISKVAQAQEDVTQKLVNQQVPRAAVLRDLTSIAQPTANGLTQDNQAMAALKEAAAQHPTDGQYDLSLANAYFSLGQVDEGLTSIREAIRKGVPGKEPTMRLTETYYLYVARRYAEASAAAGKGLALPNVPTNLAAQLKQLKDSSDNEVTKGKPLSAVGSGNPTHFTTVVAAGEKDSAILTAAASASPATNLTIIVNADGSILLQGENVGMDELLVRLKKIAAAAALGRPTVLVSPDPTTSAASVIRVIDALKQSGLTNWNLATTAAQPPSTGGTHINTIPSAAPAGGPADNGGRQVLNVNDVPPQYSVINREFIDAMGLTDINEADSWAPGQTFQTGRPLETAAPTPQFVSVLGSVNKAGRVEIPAGQTMTVVDVIAKAGGFSRLANQRAVQLTRNLPDGTAKAFTIDVQVILNGTMPITDAPTILPGDIVNVPERIF